LDFAWQTNLEVLAVQVCRLLPDVPAALEFHADRESEASSTWVVPFRRRLTCARVSENFINNFAENSLKFATRVRRGGSSSTVFRDVENNLSNSVPKYEKSKIS